MTFIFILTTILLLAYCLLILYYRQAWTSIPQYEKPPGFQPGTKLCIIVPARNEELHIRACLDSISNQTYPANWYEILVIDDHSTDRTAEIVSNYPAKNVRLLSLQENTQGELLNSYKKKAIEVAVAQATGELIVCTDADCIVPPGWLQTIAGFYQQTHAAFIAMPVCYNSHRNFLSIFQSLDFMTLQGITGASVYRRFHSMCNGANLAYSKKVFEEVGGFKGIDNIASGDDMLLMHKIYKLHPGNVWFLKSKEVIVHTAPMKTLKDFFNQRIRWASKADKYDDKRIMGVLLLVYLLNVLLAFLPVLLFFSHSIFSILQTWLSFLLFKTIIEIFFLYPVAKFFSRQQLLWLFPLAQPFHICYTVIAGWLGKFGDYQWKGRKVK